MKSKIYTKMGDRGTTVLFDGTRVSKADDRIEALGTIDELNSFIGFVTFNLDESDDTFIDDIQNDLFDIGSAIGTNTNIPVIGLSERIKTLEDQIDELTAKLPPLKDFILPKGSSAPFHVMRTITRRAERRVALLDVDPNIKIYLNRLSDFFFTIARTATLISGEKDVVWRKK